MKNVFKLTAVAMLLSFGGQVFATENIAAPTETSQYSVQLYQVPYSALGINEKDPRYNQSVKMYFALKEAGYYPLMDMLISSEARNPFTSTQILGGFAYVNKWEVENKNNLALLNQQIDLSVLADTATLPEMLLAKLVVDQSNLVGLYYTSKLLDEWKMSKPDEGLERVYSNYTKIGKYFANEVDLAVIGKVDKAQYQKIYTSAMKSLPSDLAGNLDVQFYMQSLFFKDELLRQLTEVALINTLKPNELGSITFAADVLIKGMEEANIPPLLNSYYGKKAERNKDIKFSEVDYSGVYERVYHDDERFGEAFGINRMIEIVPSSQVMKGYRFTIFNADEPLNLTATFNPNGRGLDVFESTDYYIEYTKDKKYIIMYANPSEGDEQRFVFKKVDSKTKFENKSAFKPDFNAFKEQGVTPVSTKQKVGPESVLRAWSDVVGNQFDIDVDDTQNAAWSWNTQNIYGLTPSLTSCDLTQGKCVDSLDNVTVFVNGFQNDYQIPNQCLDFTKSKVGSVPVFLSKGIYGRLLYSPEVDKMIGNDNVLAFSLPMSYDGKNTQVCVLSYFNPTEKSVDHALKFSNAVINRMAGGN